MKRRDGAIELTADELETLKTEISGRENALDEKKEFLVNEEGCYTVNTDYTNIYVSAAPKDVLSRTKRRTNFN